ncbi:MAG TPA: hypothetical protein VFP98_04095, partial [Candidatus Polarisedimenticolia bacterium]|nr:hypothetical protein [Candidatus Polarisedimenticolia bacterium]
MIVIPARKSWAWLALLLLAVVRVQFAPASDGAPVEPARLQTSSPAASQAASPPLLTGRILSAETGAPLAGARIDLLAWLEPEEARARRAARDLPGA